jgi:gliding motility associated protien GldN
MEYGFTGSSTEKKQKISVSFFQLSHYSFRQTHNTMKTVMQKTTIFRSVLFIIAAFTGICCNAQREADKMYSKQVTRAIDLREKQNQPIFAKNKEITRLLLNAVKSGEITPYTNDSLTTKMTITEFLSNLTMPASGPVVNLNIPSDTMNAFLNYGPDWRQMVSFREEYFPSDLYQMEIKEDVIFNKNTSQLKYNIHSITIFVPADHPSNVKGIQLPVATFRYSDVVQKVFSNPSVIWYNTQNESAHLSLTDAFDLRLFSSYIIKVNNAGDKMLADIYHDEKTGRYASEWAAAELMEFEHHLWEY